ncbi:hypothetical protein EDB80DRAFT_887361 [Ilyonectria destructans]|nr:hypothetical protein EDB80DRAFT_887361 [Ilyonectria destructans]
MRDTGNSWKEIRAAFPKRTLVGIRSNWVKAIKKLGRSHYDRSNCWSVAEERRLTDIVKCDQKNWGEIAKSFPNRTARSCGMRWGQLKFLTVEARDTRWEKMRLAETKSMRAIRARSWTAEEEELLKYLVVAGSTWDTILEAMPDRTRAGVYSHIRRHILKEELPSLAPQKHFEESYLAPLKKRAPTVAPIRQVPEGPRLRAPEMRVAQTSQESPNAGADLEAGMPATKQSRNTNTQSPSKSEPAKTESADLQLWVPKAGIPLARWTSSEDQLLGNPKERTGWTTDERQRLKQMKGRGASWKEITQAFPNRSLTALQTFWLKMKQAELPRKVMDDDAEVTVASMHPSLLVSRRHERVRAVTIQQIRTKWRHAMRHPNLAAYRKDVEAMEESNVKLYFQDRLRIIDEIDERGSIEQKQNCLTRVLTHLQHGILPKFYSVRFKSGVRYPGDGGLDPQVETDHESPEEDLEEFPKKAQEPERYKRGRHKERRRQSTRQATAKRRLRLALSNDPRISTYTTETFMDLNALGLALQK